MGSDREENTVGEAFELRAIGSAQTSPAVSRTRPRTRDRPLEDESAAEGIVRPIPISVRIGAGRFNRDGIDAKPDAVDGVSVKVDSRSGRPPSRRSSASGPHLSLRLRRPPFEVRANPVGFIGEKTGACGIG